VSSSAKRRTRSDKRSPADVGIALLELFAYEGDHLSYLQDAVANEMYLDTARQRESAKRHAKLVDYQMHDGRNAWTFVHFEVQTAGKMAPRQQLVTRISAPMRFARQPGVSPVPQPKSPPGTLLNPVLDRDYRTDPALAPVRVFETATTATVHPLNNELRLHTWGNEECCLPRGTTSAQIIDVAREAGAEDAFYATQAATGLAANAPVLTIEPGTTIRCLPRAAIQVGLQPGALYADGATSLITFTSAQAVPAPLPANSSAFEAV